MTQNNITVLTLTDYIKEQKIKGKKSIRWGIKGKKVLREYLEALLSDYKYDFNGSLGGFQFMGIKHF